MSALRNIPSTHPIYDLLGIRKTPKKSEAAEAIFKIINEPTNEDQSYYDQKIEKYCDNNNLTLLDKWELASESHLNRMNAGLKDCHEFTEVAIQEFLYIPSDSDIRDEREDQEQRNLYYRGEA